MQDILNIIGRTREIFDDDVQAAEGQLGEAVRRSSFLVIGGAGSVGQAVTREIFQRQPQRLHVVDISENNLVELTRDLRSSLGYIAGDFQTLPLDCASPEFEAFLAAQEPYDHVLNLSALKHVRSEKDPFTMMRMISVNILNTEAMLHYAQRAGCRKYFAVSSDKSVNAVSVMGATKSVMELCLLRASADIPVSTARFANVAFSDGSLPFGFRQRFSRRQPLSAPRDVRRYFMTPRESGQLCLMSCLLGENRDAFFPKHHDELRLTDFPGIAVRYLASQGFEAVECATEEEARQRMSELYLLQKWPCYFFDSDTSGEKGFEEFFAPGEQLDLARFDNIGVVQRSGVPAEAQSLGTSLATIRSLRRSGRWTKRDLLEPLQAVLPSFKHLDTGKHLDGRM